MMFMIYNTLYIDISITISTIQLYTGSLSGHTVHHLAVVQYTTVMTLLYSFHSLSLKWIRMIYSAELYLVLPLASVIICTFPMQGSVTWTSV